MSETQHVNLKIFGKVQGVGYRFNAKRKADLLDVHGFVRNEDDGSVYLEAEGEEKSLKKLIDWCKSGPEFSRVKRIEKEEGKVKNFEEFEIRY